MNVLCGGLTALCVGAGQILSGCPWSPDRRAQHTLRPPGTTGSSGPSDSVPGTLWRILLILSLPLSSTMPLLALQCGSVCPSSSLPVLPICRRCHRTRRPVAPCEYNSSQWHTQRQTQRRKKKEAMKGPEMYLHHSRMRAHTTTCVASCARMPCRTSLPSSSARGSMCTRSSKRQGV